MRRPQRLASRLALIPSLVPLVFAPAAAAQESVWPRPPADPVVRLESVLGKLGGFEVAVQGPVEGSPKRVQKLKRPAGVAYDARGRLLVSDSRQGVVLQIDPDLGVVLVLGSGTSPRLREPRGIAVDGAGTIYVADAGLRQVVAFEPNGEIAAVYGQGDLSEPSDVAVSPDGTRLYVADAAANQVAVFDRAERRRVDTFGERGLGAGEFILPTAVEFDAAGNLLVADQLNARVQIFDSRGTLTRALYLDNPGRPHDLATDAAGRVFVTDRARSQVQVYDPDLEPMFTLGRNGLRDGEFLAVGGVASHDDRLAVLDQAGGRVQLFRLYGIERQPEVARAPAPPAPPEPGADDTETISAPLEATRLEGGAAGAAEAEPTPPARPEPIAVEELTPTTREAAEMEAGEEPVAAVSGSASPDPEPVAEAEEARRAQEAVDLVRAWAAAWAAQDVGRYLGFYGRSFLPDGGAGRERWTERRRERLTAPASIEVEVEILETRLQPQAAEVTFIQSYRSDRFSDRVRKLLRLVPEADGWKIEREIVLETL